MAVQRVLADEAARGRREPVEAAAQVDGLGGDVNPNRRGQRQHRAAPASSTRSTACNSSEAKPGGTRTDRPSGSTTSIAARPSRPRPCPSTTRTG